MTRVDYNGTGGAASMDGIAVVLLGHGSRAVGAAEALAAVAEKLSTRLGCPVAPASLQFNQPTLEESCHRFLDAGWRRIVIAPYFLFEGNHMKLDIPKEIDGIAAALPAAELLLTRPLGSDERLVEVMQARVREALGEKRRGAGQGERQVAAPGARTETGGSAGANTALGTHPIESQSFDIIDEIIQPADAASPEYQVTRRVVHATGDPAMAEQVVFSAGALAAALAALNGGGATGAPGADGSSVVPPGVPEADDSSVVTPGAPGADGSSVVPPEAPGADGSSVVTPGAGSGSRPRIICDVRMVAAGIAPTAARLGIEVICAVDGEATAALANKEGITRGAAGLRRVALQTARPETGAALSEAPTGLDGAMVVIGNAPTALFECLRLVSEAGARPALVVGVPVGFVGAAESKKALMESDLDYITIPGNRGGSNVAAAIVNALVRLNNS